MVDEGTHTRTIQYETSSKDSKQCQQWCAAPQPLRILSEVQCLHQPYQNNKKRTLDRLVRKHRWNQHIVCKLLWNWEANYNYWFILLFCNLFTISTLRWKYSYLCQFYTYQHKSSTIFLAHMKNNITTHYLRLYIDRHIEILTGDSIYAIGDNVFLSIVSFYFIINDAIV